METKPYSQYKDSKIKWIGKLPYPWKEHKLIYSLKKITDGSHSSVPFIENGYPFVTVKNIDKYTETINFQECKKISKENYNILVRNGCKPNKGDILFSQIGTIGLTIIVKEDIDFVILSSLAILKPQNNIDKKYLKYFLQSNLIKNLCNYFMAGGAVKRITLNHISNFIFFEPPLEEQEHIAKYLDTKTTKIEQTITKNKQLITLLKEKRTTLINQTVTKGLNPDIPMKESGIEWIGKIPENWEIIRAKFLFKQRTDKGNNIQLQLLSSTQKFGVIPQELYEELSGMSAVKVKEDNDLSSFKCIHKNDYCISLRSFEGGFEFCEYEGVVSPAYSVFYPNLKINKIYYKYLFKEYCFIDNMKSYCMSLRDGKNISFENFANSYIPYPPLETQNKIGKLLDNKIKVIDKTIEKIEKNIELLEEYKESLIHHVVTGKIDVRGVEV